MPAEPTGGGDMVIPRIKIHRPMTSPCRTARLTAKQAAGAPHEAGAGGGGHDNDHDIELLEYEWPDLPPLPTIKDAITRNRVSHGISYLLPVDKGRNSINNRFRTDLRAMFQEPYASDDLQYDDNRVKLSSKVHFLSNTGDTKWTHKHLASIPVSLNAESEKMRHLYAHSAPSGGKASRRMGIDPHKLRTRSNLYLPLKAEVPPELVKLRKEVEAIIKSVKEDDEDFDEEKLKESNPQITGQNPGQGQGHGESEQQHHHTSNEGHASGHIPQPTSLVHANAQHHPAPPHGPARLSLVPGNSGHTTLSTVGGGLTETLNTQALATTLLQTVRISQERYNTYEELKNAKPPKPQIPESFKSKYLDDQQNQHIWEWLHHGEELSEFDYFLSVCG